MTAFGRFIELLTGNPSTRIPAQPALPGAPPEWIAKAQAAADSLLANFHQAQSMKMRNLFKLFPAHSGQFSILSKTLMFAWAR